MYKTGEILDGRGWHFLCKNIRKERAAKITQYAERFLEPILKQFPELKGKVHLLLRKEGWLAEYDPVLHIVIREEDLDQASEWKIRSITAHELLHLLQFSNGIGISKESSNKQIERQATFLTFARGFAYDYLKAFPAECRRNICDHQFKFSYFRCDKIYKDCCRGYSEEQFELLSGKLTELAKKYSLHDFPDYNKIVYECLIPKC